MWNRYCFLMPKKIFSKQKQIQEKKRITEFDSWYQNRLEQIALNRVRSRKQNFWPFYSKENSFQKFYTPNISLVFSIVLSSEQLLWFRLLKPFCQATKSYPLISVFSNPLFKWSLEFILWGMKIYKSKVFLFYFGFSKVS